MFVSLPSRCHIDRPTAPPSELIKTKSVYLVRWRRRTSSSSFFARCWRSPTRWASANTARHLSLYVPFHPISTNLIPPMEETKARARVSHSPFLSTHINMRYTHAAFYKTKGSNWSLDVLKIYLAERRWRREWWLSRQSDECWDDGRRTTT